MSDERPAIYLTSFGAVAAVDQGRATDVVRRAVGPGQVYSIMRAPPDYARERVDGQVLSLTPPLRAFLDVKKRRLSQQAYAALLRQKWRRDLLPAGALTFGRSSTAAEPHAVRWDGAWWLAEGPVAAGSTLVCNCAAGEFCHRAVAAPLLAAVGWRVVLDGVDQKPTAVNPAAVEPKASL